VPQREPARSQTAGEPPSLKVKMRLDEKGDWVPDVPKVETTATTEPAERPPTPDDPRGAAVNPNHLG
jgi:hypothetical protein